MILTFKNSLAYLTFLKSVSYLAKYDTSGLKPRIKENNPKTMVAEVNRQKS